MERLYLYKLTFESGATYIGQHIQTQEYDNYVTSSSYYKRNKKSGDRLIKREILIDNVSDRETLDILESIAIIEDKQVSAKNVNGNFGNYVHKMCGGWNKGVSTTEEAKEKNRQKHLGKKMSEDSKRLISAALRGIKRKSGYHLSEEHRAAISKGLKGRKISESHRLKQSLTNRGKRASEETRRKLSESHMGNKSHLGCKATEEQRRRMSEAHIGFQVSEETKEKLRRYAKEHKEEQSKLSKDRIGLVKAAYLKAKEEGFEGKWNEFQKYYASLNNK